MSPAEHYGPAIPQPFWMLVALDLWIVALALGKWWFGA